MSDWMEVLVRTLLVILALFVITRLLGKRQIAQFTYFEYITGISIGGLAAIISLDLQVHWIHGLVALSIWLLVAYCIEFLGLKSKRIRNWTDGKAEVLIKDGKILEDNLKKVRYSADDLLEQLRRKNVFSVADVEFAVLETTGEVSLLLKRENQPLTPKQLGIQVPRETEPQTVIMDGQIMDEPLATLGFSREWLFTELEKLGVALENVYLAQVNSYGEMTVDLYDDQISVPKPSSRALLWATLKKCAADLELFCLSTDNQQAKAVYEQCLEKMNGVLQDLRPYLLK